MNGSQNMEEIDQEQALNLAKFFINIGSSCFFFGQKGVGKSAIAMQAIKECGYKVNYINLSVMERYDLLGLPILDNSEIINYKSPHFLPKLLANQTPDTVILFDEIDKVSPEITAPLLEILLFKKINGQPLNVVSCILTGNLSNERAFSNQISSALLDRGAKFILNFSFEKWIDWAKANHIHDLILGFLRSNPNFACSKIEQDDLYASPSPRSWTWASQALLKSKELKMLDIDSVIQIISGYVGKEAGLHFRIWFEHYRKFEPFVKALIERGEMQTNFGDLLQTEKLVFVVSACYYAKLKVLEKSGKNKFLYLERLITFFNSCQVEKEMQIMALHNSFSFELIKEQKLYECKKFFDHFTKLNEGVKIK